MSVPASRRLLRALTMPRGAGADPEHDWTERVRWGGLAIGLYLVGWYSVGTAVRWLGRFVDVSTPLDALIPLRLGFAWGYGAIFVLAAAALLFIRDRRVFLIAAQGTIVMTVIAWVIFLAVPVRMNHRPDEAVVLMDGASATLTSFFFFIDPPLNCFPSMHLALAVWAGLMLLEDRPSLAWVVWPVMVWIGVSVLFLRQHYLADVAAGVALALGTRSFFRRVPPLGL